MIMFAFEGDEFFIRLNNTLSGVLYGLCGWEAGFGFHSRSKGKWLDSCLIIKWKNVMCIG